MLLFKLGKSRRLLFGLVLFLLFHLTGLILLRDISIALLISIVLINKNIVENVRKTVHKRLFWILLLPFFIYAYSLIYSEDFSNGWKQLETKLSLLLFPFIVGVGELKKKEFYLFLKTTVLIISVLPVIGFIHQYSLYLDVRDSGLFYNDNLVSIFNKQAVYFAFFINTSLLILFFLLEKGELKSLLNKGFVILVLLLMIGTQYLLASRTSIVMMAIILLVYSLWMIGKRLNKVQAFSALLSIVILAIGLIYTFPKVLKRFKSISNVEYRFDNPNPINHFNGEIKEENWNGLNTRLALWSCAMEKIKESPIWGFGIGDVQAELVKKYKEKNFILALKSNYNSHNQYLDFMLASGVVGFLLFLFYMIYLLMVSVRMRNWLLVGFLLTLCFAFCTENLLSRNQGVVFVSLFISLFSLTFSKLKLVN